ncbi:Solute carrier family 35 member F1-like protein [Drosera capensis]
MTMESAASGLKKVFKNRMVVGILLGQFLSLMITSTGFSSSELARRGVNAPTSQSFANYVLLALVYGSVVLYRRKPLKTKYKFKKFAGVVLCVAGLVMVVFSDVHASDPTARSNPVKGDLLVIAGSTLYAFSNVSEEFLVKSADTVELMAMLGLFGAIISACQISILERGELRSIEWNVGAVLPFVGFAVAMFLFYSLVPVLLKMNGAAMLNLSLLTSDMWTVFIRIFAYHQRVDWLYFVAFGSVAIGLFIYSWGQKEEDKIYNEVANESTDQSKNGDEEANIGDSEQAVVSVSPQKDVTEGDVVPKQRLVAPDLVLSRRASVALEHHFWGVCTGKNLAS